MILTLVKFLILGIGSSLIVLLAQIPFTTSTTQDTLQILLILTFIEETVRFFILLLTYKRNVFPSSYTLLSAAVFGVGFALGETLLSQGNITSLHMALLFLIHMLLSLLVLTGIRSKQLSLSLSIYILVLFLHMGYNTLFWFARF